MNSSGLLREIREWEEEQIYDKSAQPKFNEEGMPIDCHGHIDLTELNSMLDAEDKPLECPPPGQIRIAIVNGQQYTLQTRVYLGAMDITKSYNNGDQ